MSLHFDKKTTVVYVLVVIVFIYFGAYRAWSISHTNTSAFPGVGCPDCNVIIIALDTMRADRVSGLGYARDTTPSFDALASRGALFAQAISPASWTVPTFMSIFTSVYPSVHKVTNKFTVFTKGTKTISNLGLLSPELRTFAEVLRDAGYATGGFTGDAGVSAQFGYNQGFDIYTDEKAFGGLENSQTHALAWLDTVQDRKFFMFFHGYDLHGQFALGEGYVSRYAPKDYVGPFKGTPKEEAILREGVLTEEGITLTPEDIEFWNAWYDGKLRDMDARLGTFIRELERRNVLSRTIIVVLSDHGEEFYEHGGFDHGHSLYDEQLRVPLVFVVPGMEGGRVVESQVSTIDVAPTLLSLLGITPTNGYATQAAGRKNLAEYFVHSDTSGYDVFSETDYRDATHKRSIRTADGWKYILTLEDGKEELYHILRDPKETKNLITKEAEKAEELRVALRKHMRQNLRSDTNARVSTGCLPVYPGECE